MRYFFPEGCRGFDSEIAAEKNPMTPFIKTSTIAIPPPARTPPRVPEPKPSPVAPKPPISPPFTPAVTPTPPGPFIPKSPAPPANPAPPAYPANPTPQTPPPTQGPKITPPEKYLPPAQKYLPPAAKSPIQQQPQQPTNGRYITKAPAKSLPPTVLKPIAPKPISPFLPKSSPPLQNKISTNGDKSNCEIGNCESQTITIKMSVPDSGCVGCCVDEDSLPKIVIPIKLKNGKSESCPSYAKLIVPADSVNVNNLKSNPTELARMVLQSLA